MVLVCKPLYSQELRLAYSIQTLLFLSNVQPNRTVKLVSGRMLNFSLAVNVQVLTHRFLRSLIIHQFSQLKAILVQRRLGHLVPPMVAAGRGMKLAVIVSPYILVKYLVVLLMTTAAVSVYQMTVLTLVRGGIGFRQDVDVYAQQPPS